MNVRIMRGDQIVHNTNRNVNLITEGYGLSKVDLIDNIELLPEESKQVMILNTIKIKLSRILYSMYSVVDKRLVNEYSISNSVDRIISNCGLNNIGIRKSLGKNNMFNLLYNELFCIGFNLSCLSETDFGEYLDSVSNDICYISEIASL